MSGIWNIDSGSGGAYEIRGHWDADTNTPDISGVTVAGYAYVVSVGGATSLGGITPWVKMDIAVKTFDGWVKIEPSSATWGTIVGTLVDQVDLQNALNLKANANAVVALTGNQTVAGIKTFSSSPIIPTPTTDMQASTKKFVNDQDAIINTKLYNELSSGIKSGFTISINADTTKVDISAGKGIIVDNTDPTTPVLTEIDFVGEAAIVITDLATANATYLAIDATSTVIQQTTEFTPIQRRGLLLLGIAIHSNRTVVNVVNNLPDVSLSTTSQYNDLLDGLQEFNINGNIFSANGSNLSINKSLGHIFKRGANFLTNPLSPHTLELAALTAPNTIRYRLQDGTEYANTNVIDPNFYDLNGVKTAVLPNKFSIQRIVLFPSNLVRIQYGQAVYGSKSEAIQAIATEPFIEEANMRDNGLLRGLLVIKSGATSLTSSTDAQFLEADRFGSATFSASGGGTTTLQQAYNNSIQPQTTTTAALGAVQYKRGSASDDDTVLEVLNGAGASVVEFHGNNTNLGATALGNYTQVEANGFMAAKGTAQAYRDISLSGLAFSPGGAAAPSLINFVNANCVVYGFDGGGTTERLYVTTEMQHDYVEGTNLELHVHWTPTTTGSGNVKWQLYYTWQNKDGTYDAPTLLSVVAAARGTAWQNTYSSFGTISGAGKVINSQLVIQLFRDPTDVADTYGADAALIALGIHYKADTIGSRSISGK